MDTDHEKLRLTVAKIYLQHGFHMYEMDVLAGVPAGTTDNMLQGIPVSKMDAEGVLAVLSARIQQNYTLNNVHVALLEGETNGGTTPKNAN